MADLQKTIEIIFGGKDNVSPVVKNITKEMSSIDGVVQGIADPFADFTKGILAAEAGVAALAGAMVAFSVNEAASLQNSLNEIGTLFNATPQQVDTLKQEILEFGKESVFSFENITASTYDMISATGDVEGAVDALGIAEQAAVVGATDLNTSINALTTVTNAYGLELDSSNEVLGAFIVAVQNGKTTLPELAANIGKVATTAAASKVSFEDMLAAVSALTAGGVSTSESMTQLKALLSELAKPSSDLIAALNGVTLESGGLDGVLKQLAISTGGSFTEMRNLFGSIEATNAALLLGNDASGVFAKALDAMNDKSSVLAKNFDLMAKNSDLAMQNLVNNIKGALIEVGTPLLDEFGSAVNALSDIFKTLGIEVSSGALKPLEDALESFAQNASASLEGVAKALPEALGQLDFSGLIASFENLGGVFEDVFGQIFGEGLDLTRPEDLAKALQTAVNIAESFVNITGGIVEQFNPIFAAIGEAGQRIGGTSEETEKAIGKFLGAITLLGEFGTAMGSLAIVVNETGTDVARVFDLFGGSAKVVVNVIQSAFDLVVGTVVKSLAVIANAFEAITPDVIGDPWGAIADDLTRLGDAVGSNFSRNMNEAGDGIRQIGDAFSTIEDPAKVATVELEEVAKTSEDLSVSLADFGLVLDPVTGGLVKIGDAAAESVEGVDNLSVSADKTGNTLEKTAAKVDKLSKAEELAIKNTADMEKTLLELASNERIASMEFVADIEVAKIEGEAKKVAAAFEAISTEVAASSQAIEGMTETLGDLYALGGRNTSGADEIKRVIDREFEQKQQALNQQEALISAQVEYMRAQAEALYRDTVVTIESNGLSKDIEAFMFEILRRIQTKVAGDKSAFLLGL